MSADTAVYRFVGLDGEMTGAQKVLDFYREYALIQIGLAVAPNVTFVADIGHQTYNWTQEALDVVPVERAPILQPVVSDLEPVVHSLVAIYPCRAPAFEDPQVDISRSTRQWWPAFEVNDEGAIILTAERDLVRVVRRQNGDGEALNLPHEVREVGQESVLRGDQRVTRSRATGRLSSAPTSTCRRGGAIETRRRRGR